MFDVYGKAKRDDNNKTTILAQYYTNDDEEIIVVDENMFEFTNKHEIVYAADGGYNVQKSIGLFEQTESGSYKIVDDKKFLSVNGTVAYVYKDAKYVFHYSTNADGKTFITLKQIIRDKQTELPPNKKAN